VLYIRKQSVAEAALAAAANEQDQMLLDRLNRLRENADTWEPHSNR